MWGEREAGGELEYIGENTFEVLRRARYPVGLVVNQGINSVIYR